MDLWSYLGALRRWWWLALGVPAVALIAAVLLVPAAEWQTEFRAFVVMDSEPDNTANPFFGESIILDDIAILVDSTAMVDHVHATLPTEMQASVSAEEIADMLSAVRYSRAVTVTAGGDSAAEVMVVAESVAAYLPEAVNAYLVPPKFKEAEVRLIDPVQEPVKQTRQRLITIGAITAAAVIGGLCAVALAEGLRQGYRAKYGSR
jgi:hypothetical protein